MGRGIGESDMGSHKIAVVNETVARKYFGGGSPIGKRFRWSKGDAEPVEIVGVARDALYDRLAREAPATIYAPFTQVPWGWPQAMTFEVRVAGGTAEALTAVRRAVADIDRMLPLMDVKTMEGQIDGALAQARLFAWLVGLFGVITVALACVGIYGLAASSVSSRTREIGVRMALGADAPAVLSMVLRQIAFTVAAGLVLGLPAALFFGRIIESQLFGIKPHDPVSLALAALAVVVIAMLAAVAPAARATRIDPVRALRYE
jgi:predicted lysophospholipase L1 biosynthesis ABC-type transport system permease subunit